MREMKDSGIEWIGEIPNNWNVSKYKYHSVSRMGETLLASHTSEEYDDSHTIPVYSATQDDSIFGFVENASVLLKKGDIVIPARGNSIGCATMIKQDIATCTQTTICSQNIHNICSTYLFYCNFAFKDEWYRYDGSAIPQITVAQVENNKLPFPPLYEQCHIADFLDAKCAEIDALTADIEKQIETLEQYKHSVITEAVTKGLNPDAEMKESEVDWIGVLPKNWKTERGKYLFAQKSERGNKESLTLLSPTQNYGVIPQYLYEQLSGLSAVKLNEGTDYNLLKTVHKGAFVISLRSFQGGFEYSEYEGVVSPAYQVFYPTVTVDDRYYKYLFKTQIFIDKMNSYTISLRDGKNIAFSDFGRTYIPLPPLSEQRIIADYLDARIKDINSAVKDKKQQLTVLDSYKKSIIYEYVTGKKEVIS